MLLSKLVGLLGEYKTKNFKDIEININTPVYMLETNQNGFEKTETGYIYKGRKNMPISVVKKVVTKLNIRFKIII